MLESTSIRTLARHEVLVALRDGRSRLLVAVVAVLLAVALVSGRHDAAAHAHVAAAARAAEDAVWLDQGAKNPHSAAHFGQWVIRPLGPLAWIDRGVSDYVGPAVWLEAHWQNPFQMRPAEDATALGRFGRLTGASVLQALVPLLIVFLAFGAFAGERDRGTLRWVVAAGVRGRTLLIGKALGVATVLALTLLVGGLIAAWFVLGGDAAERGAVLARGAVFAAAHLAYFATWLAIVLAISARARSARAALVLGLGVWTLTTLLVPRLAADLAEQAHPTPSAHAFYSDIAESKAKGVDGQSTAAERRATLDQELLDRYGVETLDELPVLYAGISLQASEEHSNRVFDHHFGALHDLYKAQERWHAGAALASPLLAIRAVSRAIAGTDLDHHLHFAAASESHRRDLVERLNDDLAEHGVTDGFAYRADASLWAEMPRFDYHPPSLSEALAARRTELVVLALWLVVAAAVALREASRLRPF